MSASIAQSGLPQPNLFGGGFGLHMPQTGGIPNLQAGLAGQPLIMQPSKLEAPAFAGGYGEMGGAGGIGQDVDGGMGFGIQPMAFDGMGTNFVFYPDNSEPLAVEQSNDSEQVTTEAAVDQCKEEAPVKTRDAAVTRKKEKKSGGMCC